jgi:hypothetical protein
LLVLLSVDPFEEREEGLLAVVEAMVEAMVISWINQDTRMTPEQSEREEGVMGKSQVPEREGGIDAFEFKGLTLRSRGNLKGEWTTTTYCTMIKRDQPREVRSCVCEKKRKGFRKARRPWDT